METPYIPYTITPPGPTPTPLYLEDMASISGLSVEILENIIEGITEQIVSPVRPGLKADNLFEYINKLTINPGNLLSLSGNTLNVELVYATEDDIRNIFN